MRHLLSQIFKALRRFPSAERFDFALPFTRFHKAKARSVDENLFYRVRRDAVFLFQFVYELWLPDKIVGSCSRFAQSHRGKGNRTRYRDLVRSGANDFGYRRTNYAGSAPGEWGGCFFSCDPHEHEFKGYYGDRVGRLTLDDKLTAS